MVDVSRGSARAGVIGAGVLAIHHALSTESIDAMNT
jgi:hypothetical protein